MKLRRTIGTAAASILVVAFAAPFASAETTTVTEEYRGAAHGSALDLTVLGETVTFGVGSGHGAVDAVESTLDAEAAGVGTVLAGESAAKAGIGEQAEGCADDILPGDLDDAVTSALGALHFGLDFACGEASVTGEAANFVADGAGTVTDISITTSSIFEDERLEDLSPIFDETFGAIDQIANGVEDNDDEFEEGQKQAVDALQGVLDEAFGEGNVKIPHLDASDTLRNLVDRVKQTRFLEMSVGLARSTVKGNDVSLIAESVNEGGSLALLPGFWPDGTALVRIEVGESKAQASYDRATTTTDALADNTLVRIESRLLPSLQLRAIGEEHGLPLDEFLERTGYSAGPGFLQLKPGEGVEIFCDSADSLGQEIGTATNGLLCTEIKVGVPEVEDVSDGDLKGQRARAASVTVHVAKGVSPDALGANANSLPDLGVALPASVGDALAAAGVSGLPGLAGATTHETPEGGVHLELAGSEAEVLGTKTEVAPKTEPRDGPLPRTGGGAALPLVATALLGLGVGLRTFLHQRGG